MNIAWEINRISARETLTSKGSLFVLTKWHKVLALGADKTGDKLLQVCSKATCGLTSPSCLCCSNRLKWQQEGMHMDAKKGFLRNRAGEAVATAERNGEQLRQTSISNPDLAVVQEGGQSYLPKPLSVQFFCR